MKNYEMNIDEHVSGNSHNNQEYISIRNSITSGSALDLRMNQPKFRPGHIRVKSFGGTLNNTNSKPGNIQQHL